MVNILYGIRSGLISREMSLAAFSDWNRVPLINCSSRQAVSTSSLHGQLVPAAVGHLLMTSHVMTSRPGDDVSNETTT